MASGGRPCSVRERAQHIRRIQRTLQDANIKFASVISDVTGTSDS
jgi:hypothetical protein